MGERGNGHAQIPRSMREAKKKGGERGRAWEELIHTRALGSGPSDTGLSM